MNTRKIICIIFISILSFPLVAQQKQEDEAIKAAKVAFITEKIGLTVKEAQEFWPLYNEQEAKFDDLFEEERTISNELKKNISVLSDKDILEKTNRLIEIKLEKANLEREYHEKYKPILPIKKLALLYQTDREFRKHLLKKYNDKYCED